VLPGHGAGPLIALAYYASGGLHPMSIGPAQQPRQLHRTSGSVKCEMALFGSVATRCCLWYAGFSPALEEPNGRWPTGFRSTAMAPPRSQVIFWP
jgi:hypothetical protein